MATTKTTKEKKVKTAVKARTTKSKVEKEDGSVVAKAMTDKELPVYTMAGDVASTIALPENLFGAKWNADLVHQVVVGMQANARPITANTKMRGEVRGGGKKPWKQKGTGRARHGSSRSPIWRGGGVTHGPRAERIFAVKINQKMRRAALLSVLSRKAKDGEVIFVDKFEFAAPKTKEAKTAIVAIANAAIGAKFKHNKAALIALSSYNANTIKSFSNMGNIETEEVRNLNPVDLMTNRYLIIENPAVALKALAARLTK
jgi:large subunit ribosomal protein L4